MTSPANAGTDAPAVPGDIYELRYTATEAAHISQAIEINPDIRWHYTDHPVKPDDALRHARVGDQISLVPQTAGLAVMQLTLDDVGDSDAWWSHWVSMRDRFVDDQHCMLFGPGDGIMQCWHCPPDAKNFDKIVATENANKQDGLRFQRARLDIFAARAVVLWHPRPRWVDLIARGASGD